MKLTNKEKQLVKEYAKRLINKRIDETTNPRQVKQYIDEIYNIVSSSQDGRFGSYHKKELTKLYKSIPDSLKDKVWKAYVESCKESDDVSASELKFMALLFNKPKPNIS